MKTAISWLLLSSLSAAMLGCGSTTVTSHPLPAQELARLQGEIRDRKATVRAEPTEHLGDPNNRRHTFEGRTFLNAAVLRVVSSGGTQQIPLGQVREIDADRSGMGFLLGLVAGPLAGAGLGWLMAQSSPDSGGLEYIPVFTLGALGLLVGGPIGAFTMSGPTWRFTPPAR